MKREKPLHSACMAVVGLALSTLAARAATETVLYSFPPNAALYGRPLQDSNGDLYGTAYSLEGSGAIYRLRQKNGVWSFKNLLDFDGNNGAWPHAGLIEDHANAIFYGTTEFGGTNGEGTVFSLTPAGRGWSETVLHSFSGEDGMGGASPLYQDKTTGSLYGVADGGGDYNCGIVFQLAESGGIWTYNTLYSLKGGSSDGCYPVTQLKPGPEPGVLVGATYSGGAYGSGTLFQIKQTRGTWRESVIYSFAGGYFGAHPNDLDEGPDGTMYGVLLDGGERDYGAVFQLTPDHRKWICGNIYSFRGGDDGDRPVGINFDSGTGALYGTTEHGGKHVKMGTIFKLSYDGSSWTKTTVYNFAGGSADGANPQSRPIVDRSTGILYGTTLYGGANNGGVVYSVQP